MKGQAICSVLLTTAAFAALSCRDHGPVTISGESTLLGDSTPKLARTLDSLSCTVLEAEVLEDRMPVILPPGDPSLQFNRITCRIRFAMLNESKSLFFDSLSASVGDVYRAKPHKWVARFTFWSTGFSPLMPGERDTVELRKTTEPPYTLGGLSTGGLDSVAIYVILRTQQGDVKVLATDYVPYEIGS